MFSYSQYNIDAAPADEKSELLKAGGWCYADDLGTETLECDGRAQRTQRAGVFELKHWLRQDRRFCESSFFRARIVPDSDALHSAETCREVVATRNQTCYKVTRPFHARIVRASSLTTLPLRAHTHTRRSATSATPSARPASRAPSRT